MRFQLEVSMDNAAFDELDTANVEIRRVLRKAMAQVDATADILQIGAGCPLFDVNGNRIGAWQVIDDV